MPDLATADGQKLLGQQKSSRASKKSKKQKKGQAKQIKSTRAREGAALYLVLPLRKTFKKAKLRLVFCRKDRWG